MKKKMAWGTSAENLCNDGEYESFEEAFQDAVDESDPEVGDIIHVAEIFPYQWNVCAESLVERMSEDAYDQCGEYVDMWPDYTTEDLASLQVKLDEVVGAWLKEIGQSQPRFWTCGESKEFVVSSEHVKEKP